MKSKLVTFLLCTFLGNFGVHRFYLGKVGTGLLYLFTFGFCGIGTFIDIIKIASNTLKDKSGMDLNEDVPSAVVWTVAGIYIFLFVVGFWSGIFSEGEKVSNEAPPVPVVETPVQTPVENPIEKPVEQPKQEVVVNSYQSVSIKELCNELKDNALRAEKTYQNKYVEIIGYLSVIDSDGEYFTITGSTDILDFDSIHCSFTNDSQVDKIINLNKGDKVTVYGKITSIGEIMGYIVDVVDIK